MTLSPSSPTTDLFRQSGNSYEMIKRTVFHEAGHAVALCLGNQKKSLPPVFFQINFGCFEKKPAPVTMARSGQPNLATVTGGHLLDNLPVTILECSGYYSCQEKNSYQIACEADVFNLLVGPVSEAKYVAENDGEVFCPDLFPLEILASNYGGTVDLEYCHHFLEGLIVDPNIRMRKLKSIYREACAFVDDPDHWYVIRHLAFKLLDEQPAKADCEQLLNQIHEIVHQKTSRTRHFKSQNLSKIA